MSILKAIRKNMKWFNLSHEILKTMYYSRNSGFFGKTLTAVSIAGQLVETKYPSESVWAILSSYGFTMSDNSVGGFICEILSNSSLKSTDISAGPFAQVKIWHHSLGDIAGVFYGGRYDTGPFTIGNNSDYLSKVIKEIVWERNGHDIELSATRGDAHSWRASRKFKLIKLSSPDAMVERAAIKKYTKRISHYKNGCRTILLRGPSGVGKSVFAKKIAKKLSDGNSKTLKIASSVLGYCSTEELRSIVDILQPSVLLLDDIDLRSHSPNYFLSLFEVIHSDKSVVIITMMENLAREGKEVMGSSYFFHGMRPGRIDDSLFIAPPNKKEREDVFRFYLEMYDVELNDKLILKIAEKTKGLTEAYLKEISKRISMHNCMTWKSIWYEIKDVMKTSPDLERASAEEDKKRREDEKSRKDAKKKNNKTKR